SAPPLTRPRQNEGCRLRARSPSPARGEGMKFVKTAIRQRINQLFNDYEAGERPALRRADALFPTDSIAWRVNGDIVTMMIGGVSGLLLQMLHPAVLAGVWDHSDFRAD